MDGIIHTNRPLALRHAAKHLVQLLPVLHPLPAHKRHAHGPQSPAQKRHPFQLFFRKPATAAQHSRAQRQLLDQVEIRPVDMVADYDCGLAGWQRVAGYEDVGAVCAREEVLDVGPDCVGYEGGGVVGLCWGEEGEGEEEGEQGVCEGEVEEPG